MFLCKKSTLSLFLILILCSFSVPDKTRLKIVFIGDSITFGSGLATPASSAAPVHAVSWLLRQKNFRDVEFSNQGVSGKTTVDYLPASGKYFNNVVKAADQFSAEKEGQLIFSFMLGTNDSAIHGPHGAPVSPEAYKANLKTIADSLLAAYPDCKIIFNRPIWYSPNTYNSSMYLEEGLNRLQSYFPQIDALVSAYAISHPGRVFAGDRHAFGWFKKHYLTELNPEKGQQGTFYLHPNRKGAVSLGLFWARAISKIVK